MRHRILSRPWWLVSFALAGVAVGRDALAQGPVAGRIAIQERAGETTRDFASAVIYLVPLDGASPTMRPTPKAIAMHDREFVPRLHVVTPGSRVSFPNEDPFRHNIFSTTPGAVFDLGLYPGGQSKDAPFNRPGAYPVYCNIHPRMTAVVVVVPTPWHAQAGNDGRWSIAGVPAGRYTLTIWHERTRLHTAELVVPPTGVPDVAATLDARGFVATAHKNKFGKDYEVTGRDRY